MKRTAIALGTGLAVAFAPIAGSDQANPSAPVSFPAAGLAADASPVFLAPGEAERLVREFHYEGLPEAEAMRIGPEAAARLVEMLSDPAERAHHGQILLALGIAGPAGALEAIEAWSASAPALGEVDRAVFRAQQMLPFALAKLARRDARAVDALVERFELAVPRWHFRQFRGERLQQLERRAVLSALGESGRPAAARALDRIAAQEANSELVDHARAVRAAMGVSAEEPSVAPR